MIDDDKVTNDKKTRPNLKLILILVSLFVIIVGLITTIIVIQINSKIEILASCIDDSDTADVSTCIDDVMKKVGEVCPDSDAEAACFDRAREFINAQLGAMSDSAKKNSLEAFRVNYDVTYSRYDTAIDDASSVDVQALSSEQKFVFYNSLSVAYGGLGDKDEADLYSNMLVELMNEDDYYFIGG